jgi:TetR/AcrR family transcriptional regulator, transcriptional repressor for nem operon
MPRPLSFDVDRVVESAKAVFWEHGFITTGIECLERATGIGRSSLYNTFGSKRGFFEAALVRYEETFLEPLLGPIERPGAGLSEAAGFFISLQRLFEAPRAERGCLMINSIAELAGRDTTFTIVGARFIGRYEAGFANALVGAAAAGHIAEQCIERRSRLLAAAAAGAWITVRVEPARASAESRAIAHEIRSWALPKGSAEL